MGKDKDFWEIQRDLSFEWSRYVLTHPKVLDNIPDNAQIVFMVEDNPSFTSWSLEINKAKRKLSQPAVFVHIKRILSSRLVEPHLETTTA